MHAEGVIKPLMESPPCQRCFVPREYEAVGQPRPVMMTIEVAQPPYQIPHVSHWVADFKCQTCGTVQSFQVEQPAAGG